VPRQRNSKEAPKRIARAEVPKSRVTVTNPNRSDLDCCGSLSVPRKELSDSRVQHESIAGTGYFRFGPDAVCYGHAPRELSHLSVTGQSSGRASDVSIVIPMVQLPLRSCSDCEQPSPRALSCRHPHGRSANKTSGLVRKLYYLARPS